MSELKNLEVKEISLVDEGANPEANILLLKRKEPTSELLTRLLDKVSAQVQKAEDDKYLAIAKKYELLGEKTEELAAELKKLSASKETYNTAIKLLDKALALTEQGGLFTEIGKSGAAPTEGDFEKICAEVKKNNPTMSDRWVRDAAFQRLGGIK